MNYISIDFEKKKKNYGYASVLDLDWPRYFSLFVNLDYYDGYNFLSNVTIFLNCTIQIIGLLHLK